MHLGLLLLVATSIAMSDNVSAAAAAAEMPAGAKRLVRDDRWAEAEQPPAAESSGRASSQRWRAFAKCSQKGTGKCKGTVTCRLGPFNGATKEDAEAKRAAGVEAWLHAPKKRAKAAAAAESADAGGQQQRPAEQSPHTDPRIRREAAPSSLAEPPLAETRRTDGGAGPGRGHSVPPTEAELLPPPGVLPGTWLEQLARKELWRTERIAQLERQLKAALAENATLSARVSSTPHPSLDQAARSRAPSRRPPPRRRRLRGARPRGTRRGSSRRARRRRGAARAVLSAEHTRARLPLCAVWAV